MDFVDNFSLGPTSFSPHKQAVRLAGSITIGSTMTPSPGRIHQLPVKIHYSLEGGNQSYLTVLDGKQDVFVHPGLPTYGTDDEPGPIGSTYLKSIAQGVCYARSVLLTLGV